MTQNETLAKYFHHFFAAGPPHSIISPEAENFFEFSDYTPSSIGEIIPKIGVTERSDFMNTTKK